MKLLEKLMNAIGPSGAEAHVRSVIRKEIETHVDEITIDKFGNLIARKKGSGPKIVLAAHMDEIGLMVKSVRRDGQMQFSTIGGIEPIAVVGQSVKILNGKNKVACKGVISFEELQEDLELDESPKMENMYIDAGIDKKALKKLGIGVGSYAIATNEFTYLGNKKVFCGKAVDNRVGCYVLIELIKKLKKNCCSDLYFLFSVQEEIGMYGVQVSMYKINPDWGIAVDTTNSEDADVDRTIVKMGDGPILTLKDSEIITSKFLDDHIKMLASRKKLPIQLKVEEMGTTDATRIMLHKEGLPSTVLSIAVRNIHSSIGISHLDDVTNAVKLLKELLEKPPCMRKDVTYTKKNTQEKKSAKKKISKPRKKSMVKRKKKGKKRKKQA